MAQKFTEVSEFISGQPGHTAKLNQLVVAITEMQVAIEHLSAELAKLQPKTTTRAKAPAKAE